MPEILDQNTWGGICGFVSVIHGLQMRKPLQEFGKDLTNEQLHMRLGAEMLTYLRWAQLESPKIATEIEQFTQSFGGKYATLTYADIIRKIEQVTKNKALGDAYTTDAGDVGVGITFNAVLSYLDFVGMKYQLRCVNANLTFTQQEIRKYTDCVVGVGDKTNRGNPYKGLRHWVYIDPKQNLWNWGKVKPMNDTVDRPYKKYPHHNSIIHVIKLI